MIELKEKFKNLKSKKSLLGLGVFLSFFVGMTIAYFSSSDTMTNLFHTERYDSKTTETFVSPSDWKPGDTTAKTIKVKNTGNVCENVRIWVEEEWESENGDTLPNTQNGNSMGIINTTNIQDWVQDGNYYYYNKDLLEGQTTSSFLKSVTFNKLAMSDVTCSEQQDGSRLCESSGDGYDGATYTLTLHVETIQCSLSEKIWGVDVTDLENDYSIATFDTGQSVNGKLKKIAAGVTTASYSTSNTAVTAFKRASALPSGFTPATANTISSGASEEPIYAWIDNNIIYFYSEAEVIKLNATSSYFFYNWRALNDITDFEDIDTSSVTTFSNMFYYCQGLTSLTPLANWDVSKATTFYYMFYYCNNNNFTSLEPLSTWQIGKSLASSGTVNLSYMFYYCNKITSLEPLADWDTSKVTNMSSMFRAWTITSLTPLEDWVTSKVTNFSFMFYGCSNITTLAPISDWTFLTTSSVNMSYMFYGCSGITSLSDLSGWNTGKVTNMSYMFRGCTGLTNLTGLGSWNTGAVTQMQYMFYGCTGLSDASAINDWNISSVTYASNTSSDNRFYYMFYNCSVHPTFTNRAGTWTNGSFVPSA